METRFYSLSEAEEKLAALEGALHGCFRAPAKDARRMPIPLAPARSMEVLSPSRLPPKAGLSTREGQARLAHDLASIELQATELALRTLIEFPEAPSDFREELAEIARSEGAHFALCLENLEQLDHRFGDWPVHLALWNAVSARDTLIERVIIVHRYLEGAGLDASDSILRRLSGAELKGLRETVGRIAREEVAHVAFGSRWLRRLCQAEGRDAEHEFRQLVPRLMREIPRRERLARDLRHRAGFSESEMVALESAQADIGFRA